MKKVRVNGTVMPLVFNGDNIVIALDPSVDSKDQRVVFNKHEEHTRINMVAEVKFGVTKPKRRRMKRSPFKVILN